MGRRSSGLRPQVEGNFDMNRRWPIGVAAVAVVAGLVAAGVYGLRQSQTGIPSALSPTAMSEVGSSLAGAPAKATVPDVSIMIERLVERLQQQPDDVEGWRTLGWSYVSTGRPQEAAAAYRRALALAPDDAELHSFHGEALVQIDGGTVSPAALAEFERALQMNPKEPGSRFYIGLAKEQKGERQAALDDWRAMIAEAPADAPWLAGLRQRVMALATALGQDPATTDAPAPAAAAGATGADETQQAMIASMVAGLEARLSDNPRDADGWIMLARSRKVMGDEDAARAALARAREAFADSPDVLDRLDRAAKELALNVAN